MLLFRYEFIPVDSSFFHIQDSQESLQLLLGTQPNSSYHLMQKNDLDSSCLCLAMYVYVRLAMQVCIYLSLLKIIKIFNTILMKYHYWKNKILINSNRKISRLHLLQMAGQDKPKVLKRSVRLLFLFCQGPPRDFYNTNNSNNNSSNNSNIQ